MMKVLLTTHEYPDFVAWLYGCQPELSRQSYDAQLRARAETAFLWADFYSLNLRRLGWEAQEVVPMNVPLQLAWARERGLPVMNLFAEARGSRFPPWLNFRIDRRWALGVLREQIRSFKPDVLFVRDLNVLPASFVRDAKPMVRLVVGQHASPIRAGVDCRAYDLLLSSLPNLVDEFRRRGARAELLRLGFESSLLDRLTPIEKSVDVGFVGKLAGDHSSRGQFLAHLAGHLTIDTWGSATRGLPQAALRRFHGQAWGLKMYRVLQSFRVGLNQHETWAGPHANNLRMYETTGVGTFLLTDWKPDLHQVFEPDKEVVAYRSVEECREMVLYYVGHPEKRESIAAAGRARTLREHTYFHRMQELIGMLRKYL